MKRWSYAIVLLVLIFIIGASLSHDWSPVTQPLANDLVSKTANTETALPVAAVAATPVTTTSGQLILLDQSLYPDHKIAKFDLTTKVTTSIFTAPQESWIHQLDVSSDGSQVALSYAAPPPNEPRLAEARLPYDRSAIYLLALEELAATPILLFGNQQANEYAFNPIWSADDQSIYYVSYRRLHEHAPSTASAMTQTQTSTLDVALYRYDLASQHHTLIAKDGVWPRLSADGEALVYIYVDPVSNARGIRITDKNGENARQIVDVNAFFDIDTPLFSPDGQWIYFSAVPHSTKVSSNGGARWWEVLLSVKVAYAHADHNLASDWWRVASTGGTPEQVTALQRIISYGEFNDMNKAGNGSKQLFFATDVGIYAYTLDIGNTKLELLPLPAVYRLIAWTR